jgi:hypothetical protein
MTASTVLSFANATLFEAAHPLCLNRFFFGVPFFSGTAWST